MSEDAGSVHLAQVNMGRVKTSLDSPLLAGFVARLDEINALADRSPGFGWRLETPEGNATDLRPHDDDRILINMSVWESLDHLKAFVFRSSHRELLQQRRDWCEKFEGVYAALCWVLLGHRPPIEEAKDRLAHLAKKGPAPCAFSFRGRPGPSVAPPSRNFLPPPGAAGRSP